MSKGGVPGSGTVSQTKDDEGTPSACSDSTQSKTNATDKDDDGEDEGCPKTIVGADRRSSLSEG
jgi:hypothetical protein